MKEEYSEPSDNSSSSEGGCSDQNWTSTVSRSAYRDSHETNASGVLTRTYTGVSGGKIRTSKMLLIKLLPPFGPVIGDKLQQTYIITTNEYS